MFYKKLKSFFLSFFLEDSFCFYLMLQTNEEEEGGGGQHTFSFQISNLPPSLTVVAFQRQYLLRLKIAILSKCVVIHHLFFRLLYIFKIINLANFQDSTYLSNITEDPWGLGTSKTDRISSNLITYCISPELSTNLSFRNYLNFGSEFRIFFRLLVQGGVK